MGVIRREKERRSEGIQARLSARKRGCPDGISARRESSVIGEEKSAERVGERIAENERIKDRLSRVIERVSLLIYIGSFVFGAPVKRARAGAFIIDARDVAVYSGNLKG